MCTLISVVKCTIMYLRSWVFLINHIGQTLGHTGGVVQLGLMLLNSDMYNMECFEMFRFDF